MVNGTSQKENRGKPITHRQRQAILDALKSAPDLADGVIAAQAAQVSERLVDRSTVARIRKAEGIPTRQKADARLRAPLDRDGQERVSKLLSRIFVPGIDECYWTSAEPVNGLVPRTVRRGEFRCFWRKGKIDHLWLTPGESREFLDIVGGHMSRGMGQWATVRFLRLERLVARQVELLQAHDFATREGLEPQSLMELRSMLDGGLGPGKKALRGQAFKLLFRHPGLTARVDEFVATVLSELRARAD